MPNENQRTAGAPGEAMAPTRDGDVPPFLYEKGFVGILAAAASALRSDIAVGLDEVGFPAWGPGRVGIMAKLLDHPMSQVEIAKFLRISPPSAMELVKRLERDGYVRRTRDPEDGRRRVVSLTPRASRQVAQMRRRLVEGMNRIETRLADHGFTQEDIAHCKELLQAFTEVARAMAEEHRTSLAAKRRATDMG